MVEENCLRVVLIAFNFVFAILSIALIALAIIYGEKLSLVTIYIDNLFITFPTILLVLGILSFLFSIFGCYCTRTTHKWIFIVFLVALFCLLILELCISVIAFLNIDTEMGNKTKALMVEQVTKSHETGSNYKFHETEELLSCCGIESPEDYLQDIWSSLNAQYCCGVINCTEELENNDESYLWFQYGCANEVAAQIQQIAEEAAAIGTVYSALQVMEMMCVFIMQRRLGT